MPCSATWDRCIEQTRRLFVNLLLQQICCANRLIDAVKKTRKKQVILFPRPHIRSEIKYDKICKEALILFHVDFI